jgi:hypothetical protein
VDEAYGLKAGAVGAMEEEGYGRGAGAQDQAGGGGLPRGIFDAQPARLEGGDLTGGKDDEEAAGMEPIEALAQGLEVVAGRLRAAEWVDGDDVAGKFGDGGEQ